MTVLPRGWPGDAFDPAHAERTSQSWADAAAAGLVPLSLAEMEFELDPEIRRVVEAGLSRPQLYPVPYTAGPVGQALADFHRSRHGLDVTPEHFLLTAGVVATSHAIAALWLRPGDEAVYMAPAYHGVPESIEAQGGVAVPVRLDPFRTPAWDPAELEAAITERTRFLHLCHPHNPTGYRFDADELATIAEIARRRGIRILSNELHARIVLDGTHVAMQSVAPDLTLTLGGATKSHNLAGLGGAFAVASDLSTVRELRAGTGRRLPSSRSLQQDALRAAYSSDSPWLLTVIDRLRATRDLLAAALQARLPDVRVHRPDSTYFLWLEADPGSVPLVERLARETGIQGKPGVALRGTTEQVRLSCALSDSTLERVLAALRVEGMQKAPGEPGAFVSRARGGI